MFCIYLQNFITILNLHKLFSYYEFTISKKEVVDKNTNYNLGTFNKVNWYHFSMFSCLENSPLGTRCYGVWLSPMSMSHIKTQAWKKRHSAFCVFWDQEVLRSDNIDKKTKYKLDGTMSPKQILSTFERRYLLAGGTRQYAGRCRFPNAVYKPTKLISVPKLKT